MTTLQITLDDETFERLKELAAQANQPIEAAAEDAVREMVAQRAAEIDAISERMLARYGNLFHRLAQ